MSSPMRKRSRQSEDAGGAGRSKQKRAPVRVAADLDVVMRKCRDLRKRLEQKDSTKDVKPEDLPDKNIVEVAELSATEVVEGIEGISLRIAEQVLKKQGFSMVCCT